MKRVRPNSSFAADMFQDHQGRGRRVSRQLLPATSSLTYTLLAYPQAHSTTKGWKAFLPSFQAAALSFLRTLTVLALDVET